jgi:hypothetical protein
MSRERALSVYLRELRTACHEAADDPRLRPLLFRLLLIAPRSICELRRAERRLADLVYGNPASPPLSETACRDLLLSQAQCVG